MSRKRLPVFLSATEATQLVAAAPSRRDRLIILFGLLQGMRVSEITKLRVEHLDFDKQQLLVWQGKGGRDRILPLNKKIIDPLRQWLASRKKGWVFPSRKHDTDQPIRTRTVQLMVKAAGLRAGILRPCRPHGLRHSFATMLVRKGADIVSIKELLGHENLATTQKYVHCDGERMKKVVNLL